ncbi:MAG: Biopolymer transport protein ExbB [Verrucomicrobiota bacterium]|jgi:biopolymer transport protein ExbB/TolQ
MAATLFSSLFLANSDGGLVFAFQQSTLPGKIVLSALFVGSVFSWSVMLTKFLTLRVAQRQRERFLELFRQDRQPLRLFADDLHFEGAPVFAVYEAGCTELAYQLVGASEVDETFAQRLETAQPITPAQMRVVAVAMERAVGESALKLESQMIVLATAVSGAPFIGLLGTVWGVMETFADVAKAGSASLAAMAPGVSAALITTVTGLLVAIPAMFGYNYLVTTVRGMIVELDNFAAELTSAFEHRYVSHRPEAPVSQGAQRH